MLCACRPCPAHQLPGEPSGPVRRDPMAKNPSTNHLDLTRGHARDAASRSRSARSQRFTSPYPLSGGASSAPKPYAQSRHTIASDV